MDTPLPPDLVVVALALAAFAFVELVHRRCVAPLLPAYVALPFRDRFDWDRRVLNLAFQLIQLILNLAIMLRDPRVAADSLYGYSDFAHLVFLVVIAFYLYDSVGMIMHPAPPSTTFAWIFHHCVAIALLVYDVSYRRTSAFPASVFLISAVGHVPNELRWLLTAMNLNNRYIMNACNVMCAVVAFVACGLPPPVLIYKAAAQLNVSTVQLVTTRMRPYCTFFFTLIYLPHLILILHQCRRAYTHWNKLPQPFRPTKIE